MSQRRALIVGIDAYDAFEPLACCVDDARAMRDVLRVHWDGSRNFDCLMLTSGSRRVTLEGLRGAVEQLYAELGGGEALFYFSGHGLADAEGGSLIVQDTPAGGPGLPMRELLDGADRCDGSVVIILDCCHSGAIGNMVDDEGFHRAQLGEGVTILAASTAAQESHEGMLNSLFTELLLGALDGGAADVRGRVSAASMYAYVEQSLGSWQQRPVYKSHAKHLEALRRCEPAVPDTLLRRLPELFEDEHARVRLDPSWEHTEAAAVAENVARFDDFKRLRNARLLTTEDGKDLYFVALESLSAHLTPLGRFYWRLAENGRL